MSRPYNRRRYEENLDEKHQKLQMDLQQLQVMETYLFDELRKVNSDKTASADRKKEITDKINSVKSIRSTLLKDLKNLYTNVTGEISYNTRHLKNQNEMSGHLSRELEMANQKLKKLKAEKNNKTRLAQIGEYEFEKNIEHRSMLKTIVYASFFVLIFTFLNFKNILPTMLTKILVVITISITLLLLLQRMFWNFRRDNIDYSKFRQPGKMPPTVAPEKKNTLSLRKVLGIGCNKPSLQQLAKKAANKTNIDGFSNFMDVFPRQSTCLKKNCKQNTNTKNNLSFSLI